MRARILVVENSKSDLFLIREALETAQIDAEVHVVQDGHAAMLFIDEAEQDSAAPRLDLVLLDLNLPKKSGSEVLQHLRKSGRLHDAPVLVVSTAEMVKERSALTELAISGYFRKPSEYTEFMKLGMMVKGVLQRGCV